MGTWSYTLWSVESTEELCLQGCLLPTIIQVHAGSCLTASKNNKTIKRKRNLSKYSSVSFRGQKTLQIQETFFAPMHFPSFLSVTVRKDWPKPSCRGKETFHRTAPRSQSITEGTGLEWHCPQWAGLSYINDLWRKCSEANLIEEDLQLRWLSEVGQVDKQGYRWHSTPSHPRHTNRSFSTKTFVLSVLKSSHYYERIKHRTTFRDP